MLSKYRGWFGRGLLALGMACCLMLALAMSALASTVHVYDQAGVLNASQVQSAAQSLPDPMDIYTTNSFNGNSSSFIQQAQSHVTSSNLIVMEIDTVHHYLAIEGGSNVPLSNSQYQDAVTAFKNNYNNGDYTGATIAAIHSLGSALGSSSSSGSGSVPAPSSGLSGIGFGTLCVVGLLILAAIALFGVFRRRRGYMQPQPQPPMGGPYQQPYQGYPPDYYGPGYNQGMNPWVAGGLGAAAGGLAGYELGRESAENQQQDGQGGNFGNEGNFGGGAEGSFGNGGDFGGGAGGDFGGGGGGDFGGGGGGAGGDFGGGGSGAGGSF